jgi:hypothetical protein
MLNQSGCCSAHTHQLTSNKGSFTVWMKGSVNQSMCWVQGLGRQDELHHADHGRHEGPHKSDHSFMWGFELLSSHAQNHMK